MMNDTRVDEKNFSFSTVALDKKSARTIKEGNGSLIVDNCLLTREEVVTYQVGVDLPIQDGIKGGFRHGDYVQVYRPLEEITKAQNEYSHLPLLHDHKVVDSNSLDAKLRNDQASQLLQIHSSTRDQDLADLDFELIGSIGNTPVIKTGGLYNSLVVYTESGKEAINNGKDSLSVGYRVDYVYNPGIWENQPYDFIQKNIKGNHVTICYQGRCEAAKVADSISQNNNVYKEANEMPVNQAIQENFANSITMDESKMPPAGENLDLINNTITGIEKPSKIPNGKNTKVQDESMEETNKQAKDSTDEEESKKHVEDSDEKEKDAKDESETVKKDADKSEDDKSVKCQEEKLKTVKDSVISMDSIEALVEQKLQQKLQQIAFDSQNNNDIKHKVSELMGYSSMALDNVSPTVALDRSLDALGVNQPHWSAKEKKIALDAVHAYYVQNEQLVINNQSHVAEDSVNTNTYKGQR